MYKKPNILLFFTDQQRGDTINALGNEIMQTPVMDSLCREGTAFNRAYTPSPVCVSARCSMHYGKYPFNTGCYDNGFPMPHGKSPTFMKLLTEAGYYTHGVGKMHFSPEPKGLHGFCSRDEQSEGCDDTPGSYSRYLSEKGYDGYVFDHNGQRSEMYYIPQVSQLPAKDHPTAWVADKSIEFLKNRDKSKPFMLMTSFFHPHPPFSPPTPWNKLYRTKDIPLPLVPDGYEDMLTYMNHYQNRYKYRDRGTDVNLIRTIRAFYWACVSFVDYQMGRVIETLSNQGGLDDTLIMLTSDHGELLGDYNSVGKRSMLDSAARIPMVVRFPGRVKSGEVCAAPVSLVDVFPTFMDAAGISGAQTDGESLIDIASGRKSREYVYSQFNTEEQGIYMVASDTKKYIYSAADDKEYVFDKSISAAEDKNYAPDHPEKSALKAQLINTLTGTQASEAALDGDDWKKYPKQTIPSDDPDAGLLFQDDGRRRDAESKLPPGYTVQFPV